MNGSQAAGVSSRQQGYAVCGGKQPCVPGTKVAGAAGLDGWLSRWKGARCQGCGVLERGMDAGREAHAAGVPGSAAAAVPLSWPCSWDGGWALSPCHSAHPGNTRFTPTPATPNSSNTRSAPSPARAPASCAPPPSRPPPMEIVEGLRNPSLDKFLPTRVRASGWGWVRAGSGAPSL